MRKFRIVCLVTIFASLLSNCNSEKKSSLTNYEVVNEEKTETNSKAQLVEYVVYKDSIYNEDALKSVLMNVYENNKDKNVFENHSSPTVLGVYLFASRETINSDKSEWIAMLRKGPNETEPTISYNSVKINSLQNLNDNIQDENEIAYEALKQYLKERDLELCSFRTRLEAMEIDCIHKADAKYPDFGIKHGEYSEKLMNEEREKLAKKYNLADSIFVNVSVFAMSYCK